MSSVIEWSVLYDSLSGVSAFSDRMDILDQQRMPHMMLKSVLEQQRLLEPVFDQQRFLKFVLDEQHRLLEPVF